MKLLKEHEERKTSGKPFTDEEYAEADAEDKDTEKLDADGYFID